MSAKLSRILLCVPLLVVAVLAIKSLSGRHTAEARTDQAVQMRVPTNPARPAAQAVAGSAVAMHAASSAKASIDRGADLPAASLPGTPSGTADNALPDLRPGAQRAPAALPETSATELVRAAQRLDRCAGVPRDETAQMLAIDAARASGNRSEAELAETIASCRDVPVADRSAVTAAYIAAAESGSADAQFAAAGRFPLGTEENLYWLQPAALAGHIQAQLTLARIHLARGNATNTRIALDWLQAARSNGSFVAAHQLQQLGSAAVRE